MSFDKSSDEHRVDWDHSRAEKGPIPNDTEIIYNGDVVSQDYGFFSRLRAAEARLDAKLGIESEAIQRKLPEDKKPVRWHETLTMGLLWASGTMNTSCFATGFIGTLYFGLNLSQSVLIIIFGSLLGGAATGFAATFGPPTGLRQISVSRYAFGWWPNKLIAFLNTIVQLGWAAVACITGGLALTAVADGNLSLVVGIIILALVATFISFVGLKLILIYERYAWIIFFIIFMIFFGMTGQYADDSPNPTSGEALSADVLTFLAIIYGSSASWQTMASDYYAHYPVDTNRWMVFFFTTFGIAIPTSIGMISGAVVISTFVNRPDLGDIYTNEGLGFLIQAMLHPIGFAKFILVLLVLSGINVNVISIYSAAISCQQFARPFAKVPRFIWVLLCLVVILALALGGREQLNEYLTNFLSLLGYWCTQYFVILFSEHVIFRKANFANYDLEGWNDPKRLPVGIAAGLAFGLGIIAWVMGMSETWYTGPLSTAVLGADLANEFTFCVTAIVFIPARYFELKFIGR